MDQSRTTALACFEKAKKVSLSGDYAYALDMYLEGLRYYPDDVKDGHHQLHLVALLRHSKGGKKPTIFEIIKLFFIRKPLDKMFWAEYLFAKDPDNVFYLQNMLKASLQVDCPKTTQWICDFLFGVYKASTKPSANLYLKLAKAYQSVGVVDKALLACRNASYLRKDDIELDDMVKRLSAEVTLSRGHYEQSGSFQNSIKDPKSQAKFYSQDRVVKAQSYVKNEVAHAEKAYADNPELSKNIFNLANALADLNTDKDQDKAIKLLDAAYEKTDNFGYKERSGQIKIAAIERKIKQSADRPELVGKLKKVLAKVELDHFARCVSHNITDLAVKYEYGRRLMAGGEFDRAIVQFQAAQKDPAKKLKAMANIGVCFLKKGWLDDAVDIFEQSIALLEIKDSAIAKEIRYNLADVYDRRGHKQQALAEFRKLAQMDLSYKDVGQRVDKLRKSGK